ncbi:MAG: acyl-CoA mutase large subunit family protein [SAR324 cluster bacterium]|nr:acyl-CoA mutase large subunit family protein [SAR324 cluster bacterium]
MSESARHKGPAGSGAPQFAEAKEEFDEAKEEFAAAKEKWRREFDKRVDGDAAVRNQSRIEVKPIYTPEDWNGGYMNDLGFPGQMPMTRGIYPSMHRGKAWTQRQLVGLGTPEDTNLRQKELLRAGATGVSIGPGNVHFRGYDIDEVEPELLGTCGAAMCTVEDTDLYLKDIPIDQVSIGANDPSPFTIAAQVLTVAKQRGIPWHKLTGTSNQSDYISHFVANHMFYRLSLKGARRVLVDHIWFMNENVPNWNPLSIVGMHMQQAGATPAQAMAFALSSAILHAGDCMERGMAPDTFLPRFTFFFDVSISLFEEIAKFRAGRRLWARIVTERFGSEDPRSRRFKFHAQTSGSELTRTQPLNNITRVTVQAIAGILGGLQSLHTDSYDEALSVPTQEAARIAVNTQNILREEAHLMDVIDPLGGSYYVESMTKSMEEEIEAIIAQIDDAGGMFAAVEAGMVQAMIGESALAHQKRIDAGEDRVIGVNVYQLEDEVIDQKPLERPDPQKIQAQLARFAVYKEKRDRDAVSRALDDLAAAANDPSRNVFAEIVAASENAVTHGEIVACLRRELGFGKPLVVI